MASAGAGARALAGGRVQLAQDARCDLVGAQPLGLAVRHRADHQLVRLRALEQVHEPAAHGLGAAHDVSFPGEKLLTRAKALVPHVETELLADSKHSPPFTPGFRGWLAERVTRFLNASAGGVAPDPAPSAVGPVTSKRPD